ncbi:DinB family protein [Flavobacterium sp. MDT1-60]|uniref:DinB family protein n=1 Tax=Flavobacterium sp. MDT1-60 TaxID=1979344 RepID=UPI00177BC039|nr:DinB family protein [Flavobacterium sp. MDT1-60]QOG04787.1 DinB family protein [Flavobacterium sp. MDT1-60]
MKTALQANIVETFKNLNEIHSKFSEAELNTVPYHGSWTAGQTTQHILKACSGYATLFLGKTEKTNRKPDLYIKDIEALFLNFNIKMNSPDYLLPEITDYNKNEQTLELLNKESDLLTLAEIHNLTLTCLDFQVPGFEKFTILEWISFALIHTQRHTKQLNDIFKMLTKV